MDACIIIRNATIADIDFIVETIINAEKNGTERCGFSNTFALSIDETKDYIKQMLEEEIDGCEFSIDSFRILEIDRNPVAAIAIWIEGQNSSEQTSAFLKSNLISYILPKDKISHAASMSSVVNGIQIARSENAMQIEYVYCRPQYRGHGYMYKLLKECTDTSNADIIEVQTFGEDTPAVRLYEKLGFKITKEFISDNPDTIKYFPSNKKLLMTIKK